MSTRTTSSTADLRRALHLAFRAPTRGQTYRNLLYLLLMFPLGIGYFTLLLVGFATGLSLLVVLVGVPILLAVLATAVGLAAFERSLVRVLLGVDLHVEPIEREGDLLDRAKRLVTASRTWRSVVYLFSVYVYGTLAFGLLASITANATSFLLAPLLYQRAPVVAYGPIPSGEFALDVAFGWDALLVGMATTFRIGSWQVETLSGALLVASLGVVLLLVGLHFANGLARVWSRYARVVFSTRGE